MRRKEGRKEGNFDKYFFVNNRQMSELQTVISEFLSLKNLI